MTENSSWNSIKNMLALYINHEMAKKYSVDVNEIYDLVAEKKWTMKEMFEMCENVYLDTDTDGKKSSGDTFGLSCGSTSWTEGWYYGAGFMPAVISDDLQCTFTLGEIETIDFLDWFNDQYNDNLSVLPYDSKQYSAFLTERAMFYYSACAITVQDIGFDISAVPTPMYKESQGRYYTHFSNTYDMWCIPLTTSDYECATAVLECMASEAYRILAPTCYDVYLKVKMSTDDLSSSMYDVIRDSIIFDFSYVYGLCFSQQQPTVYIRRYINNNQTDWNSRWAGVVDTYKTEVDMILNKMK